MPTEREGQAQRNLFGEVVQQETPAPDRATGETLPSGIHPGTPFSQVGAVFEEDLPPGGVKAAKKFLPRSEDRRRCVAEVTRDAEGLTYGQVLKAYNDCVTGLAAARGRIAPEDTLLPTEVLIERMRRTLDALERHLPVDCRIEHRQGENVRITGPEDVASYLRPTIAHLPQEQLRVLWLDTRNQVIGQHMAHQGTGNSAPVRAADVFRPAMAAGATAIIIAHNHPSGDPTPSHEDINITKLLRKAGNELGIELLDHVVVGRTASGREYASIEEIVPSGQRGTPYHETAQPPTPFDPAAPRGAADPAGEYRARRPGREAAPQGTGKPLEKPDVSRGSVKPLCAAAEADIVQAARVGKQARPRAAASPGNRRVNPAPRLTPAGNRAQADPSSARHPLGRLGRRRHGVS